MKNDDARVPLAAPTSDNPLRADEGGARGLPRPETDAPSGGRCCREADPGDAHAPEGATPPRRGEEREDADEGRERRRRRLRERWREEIWNALHGSALRHPSPLDVLHYRQFLAELGRLPGPDRELLLAHAEGENYAEIAPRFGLSEPAARQRVCRARRALWQRLEAAGLVPSAGAPRSRGHRRTRPPRRPSRGADRRAASRSGPVRRPSAGAPAGRGRKGAGQAPRRSRGAQRPGERSARTAGRRSGQPVSGGPTKRSATDNPSTEGGPSHGRHPSR